MFIFWEGVNTDMLKWLNKLQMDDSTDLVGSDRWRIVESKGCSHGLVDCDSLYFEAYLWASRFIFSSSFIYLSITYIYNVMAYVDICTVPLFVAPLPIGATCEVGFLCEFPMQGLKSPMQLARWTHNSSYHEGFRNRICKIVIGKDGVPMISSKCFYLPQLLQRVSWIADFSTHKFRYINPRKPKAALNKMEGHDLISDLNS